MGLSAWGRAKPLVDEAITTALRLARSFMLFWRAALPLSRATLCYVAGARVLLGWCTAAGNEDRIRAATPRLRAV